jgi:ATP-binding cassette, subfamily B, bacterial
VSNPTLKDAPLPCIVHWNQNHFVVVYKISKSHVWIADPGSGKMKMTHQDFNQGYASDGHEGVALLLETTPDFDKDQWQGTSKGTFAYLFKYVRPHSKLMVQVLIGLLLGMLFQLIFPFLTQSLVDIGIDTRNLGFIYIVLAGQLMLFAGQTTVRFIQSWIILHISVRINVNLISDFLIKLMRLQLGFFDAKNTGDLLQRIGDHKRIESFLTQSVLSIILSLATLLVFGAVLTVYSTSILLIFLISSVLYFAWIAIFLKKRKAVDHKAFREMADSQDALIEIIQGMPEIKLQGSQFKRRWQWAGIQARLFRSQIRSLAISQYQDAGAAAITQIKDIFITFIAAKAVLDGQMTLGMMLAIQYIIGQLNGPLNQLVGFVRAAQDASISLERLGEIHNSADEESDDSPKINTIPDGNIVIEGLSFKYTGISDFVLKDIDLIIPRGQTTAIVGASGSGKTTLIKLLLGFYQASHGKIKVGATPLDQIYQKIWRENCGVVMQDGFIFSDTIANNIAESDDRTNLERVQESIHTANLHEFIASLPLGLQTRIGAKGNGISQGQKQRLLIARAVYKDPEFLFFDEATNALDANNEKVIMENMNLFLRGKTAIVVAHRLSTVKHADQIIVLDGGSVVEQGTHTALVNQKGYYYTLVKNQLELGDG